METSQLNWEATQMPGFYVMGTMALNVLTPLFPMFPFDTPENIRKPLIF